MRSMQASATLLMLAISSTVFATDHPELSELTPLLTRPNSSDEVQALVKKFQLKKIYKFASGSFTSEDQAYTLMFRENRINAIILRTSPWPKGFGEANWATHSHPLPRNLKATDCRKDVEDKFGKPNKPGGDRWTDETRELWVHFGENDADIEAVWVSAPRGQP